MTTVFLTGTDTEIGKTYVATRLLRAMKARGVRCAGYKPVAAGAEDHGAGLRNEDALALQAASCVELPYELVNPYCFAPPIAPHIAAAQAGVEISRQRLLAAEAEISAQADWVLVEGAGGWRVPLSRDMDFADLVESAGWPVVLVVGMRLGCLNHALLTAESILRRSPLLGWIANVLPPPQPALGDNLQTLVERMPVPLIGRFDAGAEAGKNIDLDRLLRAV